MKNTPEVDLYLIIDESFLIIEDEKESVLTYWKRKVEIETPTTHEMQESVTQMSVDDRLLISDAAFIMFQFKLIWGNAIFYK
jgi:hypothetical protein